MLIIILMCTKPEKQFIKWRKNKNQTLKQIEKTNIKSIWFYIVHDGNFIIFTFTQYKAWVRYVNASEQKRTIIEIIIN